MRFLEHFTNLGERGISRAERVCRKQVLVLVVGRRRAWQRLAVGVDRGEGLSAPRGTTQGKAAQQWRSPLLFSSQERTCLQFSHPRSPFALAPGRKPSLFLMSVIGELIPLQLIFMCRDSFCPFGYMGTKQRLKITRPQERT